MKAIIGNLIVGALCLCGIILPAVAAAPPPGPAAVVYFVPASLLVQTGQPVIISLTNMPTFSSLPPYGPQYQWVKDGIIIDSATNADFTIASVSMTDVGTYTAFVSGLNARSETPPLYLSVYSLVPTNSNWGSIGVPVGQFSFQYNTLPCSGKKFDSFIAEFPFYGPNTTGQLPPFTNSSNSSFLDISTCSTANGSTLDTGILVKENTKPPPSPLVVGCSDDAGSACANNSGLSTCTVSLKSGMLYRVSLYYNSSSLNGLTSIVFWWYYHN